DAGHQLVAVNPAANPGVAQRLLPDMGLNVVGRGNRTHHLVLTHRRHDSSPVRFFPPTRWAVSGHQRSIPPLVTRSFPPSALSVPRGRDKKSSRPLRSAPALR